MVLVANHQAVDNVNDIGVLNFCVLQAAKGGKDRHQYDFDCGKLLEVLHVLYQALLVISYQAKDGKEQDLLF